MYSKEHIIETLLKVLGHRTDVARQAYDYTGPAVADGEKLNTVEIPFSVPDKPRAELAYQVMRAGIRALRKIGDELQPGQRFKVKGDAKVSGSDPDKVFSVTYAIRDTPLRNPD